MVEILFHPEAEAEYQVSLAWYNAQSPRAADRFEEETNRVLKSILDTPGLYPMYDQVHRFAMLRRFPFSIVYQVLPGQIYVVAVAHSRRSAGYWRDRA